MWIPNAVLDWLKVSKDNFDALREKVSALEAERDLLKSQLTVAQTNFDWARMKLNQLELEKAALFEKVSGVKIPAPEIIKSVSPTALGALDELIGFDDIGDKMASKFGYPSHDIKN